NNAGASPKRETGALTTRAIRDQGRKPTRTLNPTRPEASTVNARTGGRARLLHVRRAIAGYQQVFPEAAELESNQLKIQIILNLL
ncbi:hypothetical protein, partial [Devosia limi]|uniref:hypothetical protein n=1 Tax=Devosia limi TaxID=288995 RepID=UPI001AEC3017